MKHGALLHASDDELVETALAFAREGLADGELVVFAVRSSTWDVLAPVLPIDRVVRLDGADPVRRPALTLAGHRQWVVDVLADGAPGVRVFGDAPTPRGTQDWAPWEHYEAAVDHAMAGLPFTAVCSYDTRVLSAGHVRAAWTSHRHVHTGSETRHNGRYREPAVALADRNCDVSVPSAPPALELEPASLPVLRETVRGALQRLGVRGRTADEFVLGVHEVAANAWRHGAPPVAVRLWPDADRIVCTVTDQGGGFGDVLAGYVRGGEGQGGAGLWIARQACDQVTWARTPEGFTVRLVSRT